MLGVDFVDSAGVIVDVDLVSQNLIVAGFKGGLKGLKFVHDHCAGLKATPHPLPVGVVEGSEYCVPKPVPDTNG